jgi:hypothetical protein
MRSMRMVSVLGGKVTVTKQTSCFASYAPKISVDCFCEVLYDVYVS